MAGCLSLSFLAWELVRVGLRTCPSTSEDDSQGQYHFHFLALGKQGHSFIVGATKDYTTQSESRMIWFCMQAFLAPWSLQAPADDAGFLTPFS